MDQQIVERMQCIEDQICIVRGGVGRGPVAPVMEIGPSPCPSACIYTLRAVTAS